MSVAAPPITGLKNFGELQERLGGIPAERIRLFPSPGTATVEDVVRIEATERVLCELVDGVLVEKAMGYEESILALAIASALRAFVIPKNLGVVSGEAGMVQLFPGLVRIPDVAYAAWDRFPDRRLPRVPVPLLVPDLVVEVLSISNTSREMQGKRSEYFGSGVRILWSIDPRSRTVEVYRAADDVRRLGGSDSLDGEDVLPGFSLPLNGLFAELDRQG